MYTTLANFVHFTAWFITSKDNVVLNIDTHYASPRQSIIQAAREWEYRTFKVFKIDRKLWIALRGE